MFFEVFSKLCRNAGKSANAVAKDLGIASGTVTEWKKGREPQNATLLKLADYFGVSIDYLIRKQEPVDDSAQNTFWENFEALCKEKGKSPVEIGRELGYSSGSVGAWKGGRVPKWSTLYKIAGHFQVPIQALIGDSAEPDEPPQDLTPLNQGDVRMIPVYESVSAGFGALAVDEVVDYVPVYIPSDAEASETISIKVHGDSMYPKIEDGDTVVVHKQDSVDSGSLAVVLLDGDEGLVKKVIYGETWIELLSINPMYKTQRFNGADVKRVRVVGLVKKIIKDV